MTDIPPGPRRSGPDGAGAESDSGGGYEAPESSVGAEDRGADAQPASAAAPVSEGDRSAQQAARQRVIIWVSIAIVAAAGVVIAFLLGSRVAQPAVVPAPSPTITASATPTPSPTPTPTVVAAPAQAAPGLHEWDELGGGECLDPYVSPWEKDFTVVDCAAPHPAQLVGRGSFGDDPAAPYPGEAALTSQLALLCAEPAVIDYGLAGAYADVQLQASYPANEAQWNKGDRAYFCFASLAGGGPITGSIAAPRG